MARPKDLRFYEIQLPQGLPEEEKWLPEYHRYSEMLVRYMEEKGAGSTAYYTSIKCLTSLRSYLLETGKPYSPENSIRWYENTGPHPKCYQATILRLSDLFRYGSIQPLNAFPKALPYTKALNEPWITLLSGFLRTRNMTESSLVQIRNCVARFLYWLQNEGISDPSGITYEILEKYYTNDEHASETSNAIYTYATGDILLYCADNGLCHHGLGWYPYFRMHERIFRIGDFTEEQQEQLEELNLESLDYPVEVYASSVEFFLEQFRDLGYSKSPREVSGYTLHNLLLFLDMHGFGYHPQIANIWLEHESAFHKVGVWRQIRRTLRMFEAFTKTGVIAPEDIFRERALLSDLLPVWCRKVISEYLVIKEKEGWEKSTLDMIRSSITRFCGFLVKSGISDFDEITPGILKDFNIHDKHNSVEGKNAYNVRIRKFIKYLERNGMVTYGLHQALYCTAAQKEKVVVTLTKEEREAIKKKLADSRTSIELRDKAMIMLGTRMGLRATDIVEMQLKDIDWDKQTLRVIQEKTDHEIMLPLPTDVGNAIYIYIIKGRPNEKTSSGNVFIKHRVPYNSVTRSVCLATLKRTLPKRNVPNSGFHVTRKTYATDRLREGTGKQGIADLLGHKDIHSLDPYLLLDEERMRMCPITLKEAGLQMKGGRYDRV